MFRSGKIVCTPVRQTSAMACRAAAVCSSVSAISRFAVVSSVPAQQQQFNNFSAVSAVSAVPFFNMRFESTQKGPAREPEGTKRSGAYLLDKQDVLARVTEVVKNFEKVDASKVTPESHFINDLGLDSLDVVEVVMALEQEFVLDIPDHEAEKIQSIPDAVDYLAANPMAK